MHFTSCSTLTISAVAGSFSAAITAPTTSSCKGQLRLLSSLHVQQLRSACCRPLVRIPETRCVRQRRRIISVACSVNAGRRGSPSDEGSASGDDDQPTPIMVNVMLHLTESTSKVLRLAEQEALLLGHTLLLCEHILVGLLQLLLFSSDRDALYNPTSAMAYQALRFSYQQGSLHQLLTAARVHHQLFHPPLSTSRRRATNNIVYTPGAMRLLHVSLQQARLLGHDDVAPEHLLLGLLQLEKEQGAHRLLEALEVDKETLQQQLALCLGLESLPEVNAGASDQELMISPNHEYIASLDVKGDDNMHDQELNNTQQDVELGSGLNSAIMNLDLQVMQEPISSMLTAYCTDLTESALQGSLDPVIGREAQVERVVQILGRKSKNNACLVGEPGVGKTAIAEGLAQRIVNGTSGHALAGKRVLSLDVARLMAGTKARGELEERLKMLMDEIRSCNGGIILFIDEIHTIVGAGDSTLDAANLLKPALARGELQCIGATTMKEYRKHMEKDPALARRFQLVEVPAPCVEETVHILRGLCARYESHHRVHYTEEALLAAAELSDRYITDRFLPDKAIDLIDEAGACVRMQLVKNRKRVAQCLDRLLQWTPGDDHIVQPTAVVADEEDQRISSNEIDNSVVSAAHIQHIVGAWTGIPVENLSCEESQRLLRMEAELRQTIIGQEEAIKAVSRALRRARVGLRNPNRPIASFMFCGPTGVGKSQLAKTLASSYFGSENAMVRLDMSEYMEKHSVSKLIGSPPGYEGYNESGQLTEAVRRRPFTILLLDEIEKAHPDVFNLMLQILEDGRLTDSKGRVVDFKNTLIIMTSNVGSDAIVHKGRGRLGFLHVEEAASTCLLSSGHSCELVEAELKQCFKPEFLNRLDEIVMFNPLSRAAVQHITHLMIEEVVDRLKDNMQIRVQVSDALREQIALEGFCPSYGARPLRRAITRIVEDGVAEHMLAGNLKQGDSAILDVNNNNNVQDDKISATDSCTIRVIPSSDRNNIK